MRCTGGNERSDTCTAFFVLTLVKTRLRLSNQKGWANYPDGSRQLSNITKLAIVGHTISPPSVLPLRGSRAAVQNYRHLLGWKRASSLKERSAGAGNRLPHSDSPPAVRRNRKSAHSGGETRYKCLSSLSLETLDFASSTLSTLHNFAMLDPHHGPFYCLPRGDSRTMREQASLSFPHRL